MLGVAHRGALVVALTVLHLGAAPPRRVVVNPIEVSVENANAGLEALRSECVSVRAGPGAIQCDDFVFRYDFMPLLRLQRPRTLSLLYNSATAYPRPVVGANILIPTGQSVPDEVRARLLVDGVVLDSLTVDGSLLTAGVPLRVAFTFEQYEERGNRIVPFRVEVTAWDNAQAGATASDEGHYIIVDRREEFGRGWWPTGYEKLEFSAVNDTLLWVGGDGSARAYAPVSTFANQWKALTRARPDTIRLEAVDSAYYLDLDGTEYGTVSNPTGLEDVSRMTWAFWLYPTGYSGRIGGMSSGSDPNRVWWFEADDSGTEFVTVLFNDSIGEPVYRTTTGDALSSNAWQFVVVQFDGTQATALQRLKLWINGQAETLSVPDGMYNYPLPSSLASSATAPFQWGSVSAYTPGFKGRIGETAILDTVLSSTERGAWLAAGIDFDHAGLVSGYRWENNLTDSEGVNTLSAQGIGSGDYVPTLAYRSRSISATGSYHRSLIGGGEVEYNATGRHVQTVDRIGNVTEFVHTTVPGTGEVRLSSILLPKFSGRDTAFVFQWDSLRLEAVKVRFRDSGDQKWLSYLVSTDTTPGGQPDHDAYTIRHITTPSGDGRTFYFGYEDWKGVLDSIQDFRGASTVLSYTNSKVSRVRTLATGYVDTLKYEAYTLVGSGTSGALAPVADSAVSAKLDGPRTDVGDTTRFWPTGWGAVRKVRDALGAETSVARGNTSYPAFPTRLAYPNTRVVLASYDGLGLLQSVTDSSISATTTYEWDTKWSRVKKITSPENVVTLRAYEVGNGNLLRETIGNDTTVHTTRYSYNEPNGLVTRIRPPGYGVDTTYTFGYDTWGNVNSQGTPKGFVTYTHKDPMGRDTLIVSPIEGTLVSRRLIKRDLMGRDSLSRTTSTKDSAWIEVHTRYNEQKDRTAVETWAWHPTEGEVRGDSLGWAYDQLGRVHEEISPAGFTYQYDLAGNVTARLRGADTIPLQQTYYDALNRPDSVITRAATFSASTWVLGIDTFPAVTIPRDKATFTYDPATGDMRTANNRYARISRTYTPDGLVATDTLHIRALADTTDYSTHSYVIGYRYDLDRRRTHVDHEGWLLGGDAGSTEYAYNALGFLESVTDPDDQPYVFGYDAKDRSVSKHFPGTGLDTLVYDLDGRLVWRSITTALDSTGYFAWGMDYDKRDKLIAASGAGSSGAFDYSGLGHLIDAIRHTEFGVVIDEEETFTNDGHGNVVFRQFYPSEIPPDRPYLKWTHTYDTHSRLEDSKEVWTYVDPAYAISGWEPDSTHYTYDDWGRREYSYKVSHFWAELDELNPPAELGALHREESRSYFGADDKLWFQQTSRDSVYYTSQEAAVDDPDWHTGAFETYWYDALGRRVLKNSNQGAPYCTREPVWEGRNRCYSALERYVWDGDQLLYEVRRADTLDVRNADPGDQTGEIVYVHAGEVDAPLGIIRNGTPIMLHRDWRGMHAFSTGTSGEHTSCVLEVPAFCDKDDVDWPAGSRRAYLEPFSVGIGVWYGSLTASQGDASGLLYRKNRYYDPQAAQFTQADVIGIAGGLNLYGYANGDPINNSDPFGLCGPLTAQCVGAAIGAGVGLGMEFVSQLRSGGGLDGLDLATAFVTGGLSGALTVSGGAGAWWGAARYGGQAVLSTAEGVLQGERSGAEIATNAFTGVLGEGIGGRLAKASAPFRQGASNLIDRLTEGPATLLSGREAGSVIAEIRRALFRRDLIEGGVAGVAAGAGSEVMDRVRNR